MDFNLGIRKYTLDLKRFFRFLFSVENWSLFPLEISLTQIRLDSWEQQTFGRWKSFCSVGVNLCSIKPSAAVSHIDLDIMSTLLQQQNQIELEKTVLCCEVAMLAQELLLHALIPNI